MYLSTDDARSDFFLAAAVYIIGPTLLTLLWRALGGVVGGGIGLWVQTIITPILLVSAMPLYLMRYRGESLRVVLGGRSDAILIGAALGAPIVIGTLLGDLRGGTDPVAAVTGNFTNLRLLTGRTLLWVSLAILVIFLYRRAEYAFRSISEDLAVLTQRAVIATVGVAVIASVLLLPTGRDIGNILAPLGFGAAYLLALRLTPPRGLGEQWQVYAPLITLALGSMEIFSLLFDPVDFVAGARTAGMVTGFGLLSIMGLECGKGGRMVLALSLVIALLTSVTVFIR